MKAKLFILIVILIFSMAGCGITNYEKIKQTHASTKISDDESAITTTNISDTSKAQDSQAIKVSLEREYILPDSSQRVISEHELEFFDKFTLALAKNEIFARKGYKFKDPDLNAYFSLRKWYNPIASGNVDYDDLSEIEKKNFNTIDKKYKTFSLRGNSESKYTQSINIDLNKDGIKENIKVVYLNGDGDTSCLITVTSSGKEFSYKESANLFNNLFIADFNYDDDFIEFYILDDGPSGDPLTHIFRLQDNQILKVNELGGFLTAYDGKGKIFTEYSRTWDKYKQTLSYYELEKGVVYLDKQALEGKLLQYDHGLILFDGLNPENAFLQSELSKTSSESELKWLIERYDPERIVKVCGPNELLKIVDVDNTYFGLFENGSVNNIRILVETADGKRGWLEWLNGGD